MFSKRLTKQIQVCWPQDEITATNLNKLLANIFYGDPEGVKSILRHDNDLLQINCPNIQGLTVLQYAWLLRDLNMTKLLLAHFSQLNNGIEMAYEQIKDFMPDKSTYSSRHRNLFYNTINFDILAKKIIFHGDKRTDYGNLRRFRERCKDIGHFDIYDLRSLLSLINTECPDYFSAHHIHRETNDGTSQSEIYAFIGEHVLNYMMRFSPQYLKAAWSDRLLDMRQFDKYFLKELEEWVINYEKSLTEAFSALRKDMKHDMRLNKFSNIMHGIFSRKEKSKPKKNTIEPIRNCPH